MLGFNKNYKMEQEKKKFEWKNTDEPVLIEVEN